MKPEHFIEQYQNAQLPDHDWLNAIRDSAIETFETIQFPAIKNEAWKYTRAHQFIKTDYAINDTLETVKNTVVAKHTLMADNVIVFIDGVYAPAYSTSTIAQSLENALGSNIVKPYLTKIADSNASGFNALNTAMIKHGVVIHVECPSEQPLQILHLNTGKQIINHVRNLFVIEDNAQATVIESYVALKPQNYFNNVVNEVVLKNNAELNLIRIQKESAMAQHIASTYVMQQRDSRFRHYNFDFGGQRTRHWLQSNLDAANAQSHFDGLYLLNEGQHIDNHTRIEHNHAHTESFELYKGILMEKSRAVFNGQVYIAPQAQKVNAEQQNANLLLEQAAEIDTKPQLEIYADDVKCSHGATIGQLDNTALYYLQSRGLSEASAKAVLIRGFAQEVIDKITIESIHNYLTAFLNKWLDDE